KNLKKSMKSIRILYGSRVAASSWLVLLCVFMASANAQTGGTVTGIVRDYNTQPIVGASVRLATPTDTLQASTDNEGRYSFNNVRARAFTLIITSLGYDTTRREQAFAEGSNTLNVP